MPCVVCVSLAEKQGVQAISAVPPVFFKTSSVKNLVNTMAAIAGAAPRTPFIYCEQAAKLIHISTFSVLNICFLHVWLEQTTSRIARASWRAAASTTSSCRPL